MKIILRSVALTATCVACANARSDAQRAAARAGDADDCGAISVSPDTLAFVDACGRQRYFRGVNVVVKSWPWMPSEDTFTPGSSLTPADSAGMQSMGFNILRLGMMWPGVELSPGYINTTYLTTMANMISDIYTQAGIYSLVDAHQDLLSDAYCGDGAPVWEAQQMNTLPAADAFPVPLQATPFAINPATGTPSWQDCGKYSWSAFYLSRAVNQGFGQLYANTTHSQRFGAFWDAVVRSLASVGPAVHSYELLNEPWPGDIFADPAMLIPGIGDLQNLQPLYTYLESVIRAAENATATQGRIILSEAITYDDFFPVGFTQIPGTSTGLGALSYHYYELPNFDPALQVTSRLKDAQRLRAGAILTEFDIDIAAPWEPMSVESLRHVIDVADANGQSYIGWAYADMWFPNGTFDLATATELTRPFPSAVAGTNVSYAYTFSNGSQPARFALTFTLDSSVAAPTTVYLNTQLHFASGPHVTLYSSPPVPGLTYAIEWHNNTAAAPTNAEIGAAQAGADLPPVFSFAYLHVSHNASDASLASDSKVTLIVTG